MGRCRYQLLTQRTAFVIDALPFRGQFVTAVWPKVWGLGPRPTVPLEVRRRPDVKKVKLGGTSAVKHLAALESEYFADVMPVVEALAMLQYDDGSPRQTGYVGVWVQGSAWVVRLTDKDADAQLTAEGRTLDEALDLLALLLGTEDAPWEPISRRKKKAS